MAIHFNERYSGGSHVTAIDEAAVKGAIIGGTNCVIDTRNNLAITVEPTTGGVSIADGVFSFNGRCGWTDGASDTFVPASSDTTYKKLIVGFKYDKNQSTGEESISLKTYETSEKTSLQEAKETSITLPSDTITSSTTSAFFPLWEFIVNASITTNPERKFEILKNLKELNNALEEEETNRQSNINDLTTSIQSVQDQIDGLSEDIQNQSEDIQNQIDSLSAIDAMTVQAAIKIANWAKPTQGGYTLGNGYPGYPHHNQILLTGKPLVLVVCISAGGSSRTYSQLIPLIFGDYNDRLDITNSVRFPVFDTDNGYMVEKLYFKMTYDANANKTEFRASRETHNNSNFTFHINNIRYIYI